ncbi:MAG: Sak single strand annealing protein [Candidatus Heimdallarchaeota archaeon]
MTDISTFSVLNKINVKSKLEKKGRFNYLSWAYAVTELKKAFPKSTWEVKRYDGVPYMKTDLGYFVEVSVTVEDVVMSQIHPVLDYENKPILKPNAFQINTSIQRCLVKAIALHGLGLSVYAGEDIPQKNNYEKHYPKYKPNNIYIDIPDKITKATVARKLKNVSDLGDPSKVKKAIEDLSEKEIELIGIENLENTMEYYIKMSQGVNNEKK